MTPALACSVSERAPLGGRDPRQGRTEDRGAQSGQKLAPVQPENSICHGSMRTIFRWICPVPGTPEADRPFFCCGPVGSCYKPAATITFDLLRIQIMT